MAATVFERVRKIITEQLGVEEDQVVPSASFVDDLGADCREATSGDEQSRGHGDQSVSHLNSFGLNMLNNSSKRPKTPVSPRGFCSGRRRISSFENPASTCPAVARAVHQLVP